MTETGNAGDEMSELSPEDRRELGVKMRKLGEDLAPLLYEALNSDRKRELVAELRRRNIHLSGGDWTLAQIEALAEVASTFTEQEG